MERFLWKGKVKAGCTAEYIRRHNEIWPEMVEELKKAGIQNYSIWMSANNELCGYYECPDVEEARKIQADSPIVQKWEVYMEDILEFALDENGQQEKQTMVFYLA